MEAYTIVRHTVLDFARWKKVFDEFEPFRKKNGETTAAVIQVEGDQKDVVVISTWASLDAARAFFDRKELKEAMEKAGVANDPEFVFGEEAVPASTSP